MGSLTSRQNAGVEEVDISSNHAYKYPPRSGNYFGSHFIMGGERFDTPQPEAYLFGENADLNFLGSKPTPFPYPPPQVNEPTKTLKSLINIRKESLRFVRVTSNSALKGSPVENKPSETKVVELDDSEKGVNIEFIFDCDSRCAITVYYLCQEEISATGVTYLASNPTLTSETYHFKKGSGQTFCQPSHICYPGTFDEDQLTYNPDRELIPVAIHCVAEEPADEPRQSHTTIAVIDRHSDGSFGLRALKQKLYVDGLSYLLQEIYGIENKNSEINKGSVDTETEDSGSECVICMCDGRDTLILPCRHLCLCNSCADSLRYQANNCPICRAPFRALLQIRALQKCSSSVVPAPGPTEGTFGAIPAGYEAVSLLEALNGPSQTPRPVPQSPLAPPAGTPETETSSAVQAVEALNRSSLDSKGPSRPGETREKGSSPSSEDLNLAPEFRMSVLLNRDHSTSPSNENGGRTSPLLPSSKRPSKRDKAALRARDTVHVVDETLEGGDQSEGEPDSEAEKLSPLLDASTSTDPIVSKGSPRGENIPSSPPHPGSLLSQAPAASADDSDYYTPDDQGPGILIDSEKSEPRPAPSISAGNTPVRAPGTPLSAATSHRSSGDSFSSSSSTRQLLPPVAVASNGTTVTHQGTDASVSLQDVAMV